MQFGFELVNERDIPELNTHARLFRHVRTGARLLSLENKDENKVFGITFRTPPGDSTGVAHIMEHAVLCGSRKYPVKEPFVELVKGSLNTFLNAMTFPDKTCYPVASQNLRDFYNLVDVYLDAVFYPLITEQTLQQEGWHYELENLDAPLNYKGVVFNEMKGAYSSPDSLLARFAQQSLFPDNTYGVDSGGDPEHIPDLTSSQFKAFHTTYYHPSNAYIYFYGDDDPEARLRILDEYLRDFQSASVDSYVRLQPPFQEPQSLEVPYDAGEDANEKKGMLVVNWLLGEPQTAESRLALSILGYILIGTHASPLRKTLIDSGLGEDLAGIGVENDLRQWYFSTGMKGVADGSGTEQANFERLENLIHSTLVELAQNGIDPETVAAALNTIEFRLRENNTGSFPRGLLLMLRSLSTWLYDGDPLAPLAFDAPLAAIKTRLLDGERVFENLIRQYLIENSHRSVVVLRPTEGLRDQKEVEEKEKLAALRSSMKATELETIIQNTRQLKIHQETPDSPESLATIPALKLEDLDRQNKSIPLEVSRICGAETLFHDLFTNGIIYLDLGFNLHGLPQEHLPYLSLFGRALLEMGAAGADFVRLSQRIGRSTGGIRPVIYTSSIAGQKDAAAWFFLRGKATLQHGADLLGILADVLLSPWLDNQARFRQIVLEEKADMEAILVPAGHRIANTRLRAFFSEAGWVDEQISGVSYLTFLRKLAAQVDADWPGVLAHLQAVRATLLNRNAMLVNITLDQAGWQVFQPQLVEFLEQLPAVTFDPITWERDLLPRNEGLTIPAQVNYVGKGGNIFDLGYEMDGSVSVINNYLRTTWLWEKVRVQGGAYGGFCLFDHRSGIFSYLSYRDPNLLDTLAVYDGSGQYLRQLDSSRLTPEELTKTIIGTIGDMDAYQLPDAKGFTSMSRYLAKETDSERQRRRNQIFSTSLEHFHAFGEVLDRLQNSSKVVVIGSEQALKQANDGDQPWLHIQKVL